MKAEVGEIKSQHLRGVAFDVQDSQLQLLQQRYPIALIGQRPMAIRAKSIDVLDQLVAKESVPPFVDTGVDVVTVKGVEGYKSMSHGGGGLPGPGHRREGSGRKGKTPWQCFRASSPYRRATQA